MITRVSYKNAKCCEWKRPYNMSMQPSQKVLQSVGASPVLLEQITPVLLRLFMFGVISAISGAHG